MNAKPRNRISLLIAGLLLALGVWPAVQAQPTTVKSALSVLRQWQLDWTSYHLLIEIEGQFVRQVSNFYCHPVAGGRLWKLDTRTYQPTESRMIFQETPGDVVAYFPEIDYHVFTKILPGYADLLFPTMQGLTDEDRILEKTKASSLTAQGDIYSLTLVFDARQLNLTPPNSEITTIIRFDISGQIREVEQRRLGLSQIATFTYLTFNLDEVRARMPVTPDPVLADPEISFQDALEESTIHFTKQKQAERNRL